MSAYVSDVICQLSELQEITCEIPLTDDTLLHIFNSRSSRVIHVEVNILDIHNFLIHFSLPIT